MTYTIKQVSEMMSLPVSTIRYYDKMGLIPFLEKNESGYRIFKEKDISMLRIIECFKNTGMSISEMQQYVEMVKRGDESLEERYQLFVRRKEIVLEEMRQLEKQLETIDHKLWYYETAIKAGTEDIHKKNPLVLQRGFFVWSYSPSICLIKHSLPCSKTVFPL